MAYGNCRLYLKESGLQDSAEPIGTHDAAKTKVEKNPDKKEFAAVDQYYRARRAFSAACVALLLSAVAYVLALVPELVGQQPIPATCCGDKRDATAGAPATETEMPALPPSSAPPKSDPGSSLTPPRSTTCNCQPSQIELG